jgi:hypothetical protein
MHARKTETLVLDMSLPQNAPHTRLGVPSNITDRGFFDLARTCRNLRHVELVDCDLTDTGLEALIMAGRDLEVLELTTTDSAMKALAAVATANPGSIDIASLASTLPLRNLSDRSLQNVFRNCLVSLRPKLIFMIEPSNLLFLLDSYCVG